MRIRASLNDYDIVLQSTEVGNDLNIVIFGGKVPHIGVVAIGTVGPSAHDLEHKTTTVSLITLPGHKEDVLAREMVKYIAKELDKTVVLSCGIHIPNITTELMKS